ncbi:MAG: LysR family transcriptional regulator [Eubacteriales bacterium]|nr:LysR family transcriptional regulator [Eubacteriales bacterium]
MTIRHMEIFQAVYRAGSVTRAAEALHMTQPSVSRTVQEIERAYGVTLFDRMNRRLYPTADAHELYAWTMRITDACEAMDKSMLRRDGHGEIRVGATLTLGACDLPQLVRRLSSELPGLTIRATVAPGAALRQMLLDNRLDLALMEGDVQDESLLCRPFGEDTLCLIAPPGHPLTMQPSISLAQAASYPLLLRDEGSVCRMQVDRLLTSNQCRKEPLWTSASNEALIRAVASGLGVSILPEKVVRRDAQEGSVAVVPVTGCDFTRPVGAVWHKSKYLNESMQRLIALLMHKEEPL